VTRFSRPLAELDGGAARETTTESWHVVPAPRKLDPLSRR